MTKLSDYVMQFVHDLGIRHLFMLPGGGAMHLNDSAGKCEGLEPVCNLHEQACAIAAEAYSRTTGNMGAVLVTTGPGGTNAVTGVAGAWLESTPMLVISGQVKRADLKSDLGVRQLGLQEIGITDIVSPITKYAVTITEPESIRYHLEKAVHLAKSGRPGPVWLDIPLDVQASRIDPERLEGFHAPAGTAGDGCLSEQVAQTVRLLNQSERPVLLAGNGIHLSHAQADFRRLVEILRIPVLTTWMGADLLYHEHRFFFGKPGTAASRGANFTIQNADLLISVGTRLDFAVTGFDQSQFARGAKKVVVDVDRAEIRKLKTNVDVPVVADARDFILRMIAEQGAIAYPDRCEWFGRCCEWRRKYPVVLPEHRQQNECVSTYVFADILSDELTGDDRIIPGSSGAGIDAFWLAFRVKDGQRLFSTGGLGAMGFGIPAVIGGCLGSGGKRTVSVDGDGGFQLNIQELETVRRLGLPTKFFVLNNQGYASIRAMQRNHFAGHLVGCDAASGMTLPNLGRIASAYGIAFVRITKHSRLREDIRDVLSAPGPVICEVMTDPDQAVAPRCSSAVRPDGSMVSRPLEDMYPFLDREEFRANMIIPPLED